MSKYSSVHPKMDRAERAKQFMPFAALKGYEEALRAKENEMLYKAENQLETETLEKPEYDYSDLESYDFGDS